MIGRNARPVRFVGSSRKDLRQFPETVRENVGYALFLAQTGKQSRLAKPLSGFGGTSVMEIVNDYAGNAYRTVYTTSLDDVVYVLHCFQKKAKRGVRTP